MSWKRFVVELGMGIEIHEQDMTRAAIKAVKDAISRICIGAGLKELFNLTGREDIRLDVLIACPRPEEVRSEEIRTILMPRKSDIKIVSGGMVARGHRDPYYHDTSDEIIVANAAITVLVDAATISLPR